MPSRRSRAADPRLLAKLDNGAHLRQRELRLSSPTFVLERRDGGQDDMAALTLLSAPAVDAHDCAIMCEAAGGRRDLVSAPDLGRDRTERLKPLTRCVLKVQEIAAHLRRMLWSVLAHHADRSIFHLAGILTLRPTRSHPARPSRAYRDRVGAPDEFVCLGTAIVWRAVDRSLRLDFFSFLSSIPSSSWDGMSL
jgi:hypothetical protein